MDLSDEQKQVVRTWVDEGCGLSEIQSRLSTELGVTMTYMDVRFLVLDLGLDVQEKPSAQPAKRSDAAPAADSPAMGAPGMPEPDPLGGAIPGGVSIEISRVTKPGSLVSGTVTFSDGVTANWSLDQFGRLSLLASQEGYQPSEQDVQLFQVELKKALETKGF